MPDGPTPKAPDDDDGFDARTRHQAAVPREMPATDNLFDREHVADGDRGLLQEQARCDAQPRASHHRAFLKLQYSPATRSAARADRHDE